MQGYFVPKNPHKYMGDLTKIRYMSSYEYEMHTFLDSNTAVLRWASEEIAIPYVKPTDRKVHRYYPDYWMEYVDKSGEIKRQLIEVKPLSQTKTPSKNRKHHLYETLTFSVNVAKWKAATEWCKRQSAHDGITVTFKIVTEKSLFR